VVKLWPLPWRCPHCGGTHCDVHPTSTVALTLYVNTGDMTSTTSYTAHGSTLTCGATITISSTSSGSTHYEIGDPVSEVDAPARRKLVYPHPRGSPRPTLKPPPRTVQRRQRGRYNARHCPTRHFHRT